MMNLQDHLLKVQLITSETTPQKATQAAETLTKQKQNLKSVSSASSSLSGSVLYFSFAKQNNEQTHCVNDRWWTLESYDFETVGEQRFSFFNVYLTIDATRPIEF